MEFVKKVSLPIAICLMAISTYFSVKLFSNFANSPTDKIVFGMIAFFFQVCISLMYTMGSHYKKSSPGQSLWCYGAWLMLFCMSVGGTIGSFSMENERQIEHAQVFDTRMNTLKGFMKDYNKRIDTYSDQISDLLKDRMIASAKGVQSRLDSALAERKNIQEEIRNYRATPVGETMFRVIAYFFGVEKPETVKFFIWLMLGLTLDILQFIFIKFALLEGSGGKVKKRSPVGATP